MSRKKKSKPSEFLIRFIIGSTLIVSVFYYYIRTLNQINEGKFKKKPEEVFVKLDLVTNSQFFEDDFFYKAGEGVFDWDLENKILTIEPHVDFFVSLSHKMKLEKKEMENFIFKFKYRYTLSGNNNPHKEVGGVVIMTNERGSKNIYTTYPACKDESKEWKTCEYSVKRVGKPNFMILRLGATSYYKRVQFKDLSLTARIKQN